MPLSKNFNADERSKERNSVTITIAGETYRPVPMTNKAVDRVIAIEDEQRKRTEGQSEEDQARVAFSNVYETLTAMIVREDGSEPSQEQLADALEVADALTLYNALLPGGTDEDAPEGNG